MNRLVTPSGPGSLRSNTCTSISSRLCIFPQQDKMTCKACSANRVVLRNSKNPESTNVHTTNNDRNDVTPIGRDGGYAWVILAGSFYSSFCMEGLIGSFGLLLPTLMEEFRASAAVVSMLNSSLIGIFLVLGGPYSPVLLQIVPNTSIPRVYSNRILF